MRLNNYPNRHDLLFDWVEEVVPAGAHILDIGANNGSFCPEAQRMAAHAGLLAGVDPDGRRLRCNPFVSQRFEAPLETADIPSESFDCAYAVYVLEHVEDPLAFLGAAFRILRQGGSLFFVTPNSNHYFAAISGLLARFSAQGAVLQQLRPQTLVSQYHYPARYRINNARTIARMGHSVGFVKSEFRYSERIEELLPYFPRPTRFIPYAWEVMVRTLRREDLLCNLYGRLIKGHSAPATDESRPPDMGGSQDVRFGPPSAPAAA